MASLRMACYFIYRSSNKPLNKMKFIISLLLISCCSFSNAQTVKHVVLISIDGLRPEFYLDAQYPTPNLQKMKASGAYARKVKSVFPSYTYPSHVTMLTGALPARSGIYYNVPIGSTGDWNWFIKDIKVKTIWSALKENNLSSAAVEWPVSVGDIIDYNIPEIWSKEHPEDRITESRKYATKGLVEDIEKDATGVLNGDNMNEEFLCLDANSGRIAAYILQKYKPGFMALHFAGVDGAQHGYGRDGIEVKKALANVDNAIGMVEEAVRRAGLTDSTVILVTGDHGFMDMHDIIKPNTWLAEARLLVPGSNQWKARFVAAGGSAFLYLRDKNDKKTLDNVLDLLNGLPLSQKKLFNIYKRKKLDEMGADSSAAIALSAVPGVVFSGGIVENKSNGMLTPISGGHHGYDPNYPEMYTGFIASGANINKTVIDIMGVEDIAPLIAKLLGFQFVSPDGILLPSIIKAEK